MKARNNFNFVTIFIDYKIQLIRIIFGDTNQKITYLYAATGQKMQKQVTQNSHTATTQYMGGYQYSNTRLQFFSTSEGYVKNTIIQGQNSYDYIYNLTDHLGNIRMSFGLDPKTQQLVKFEENNYYPFGLKHSRYNDQLREITEKQSYSIQIENFITEKRSAQKTLAIPSNPDAEDIVLENSGYQYKYNSKEWQDELGLNVTAMDWRQYDPAIGRFNVMDPLSELAPTHTPYKFGFNNPVYWSDPSGLFETRKEAREYRKEHGISGGISKQKDGTFAINDKKNGVSYSKGDDSQANEIFDNDGVQESALVQAPAKKESSSGGAGFGWMTIWGTDRSGDTSGWKGTTTHSLESSDFIAPQSSRSLNNKSTGIWEWVLSLFKNSTDTYTQGITIQEAVKKNGNTATMEVQNTEPVVTSSVKVVTYTFHLNDSTVTKNTNTVDFKGKASDVKKQVDSTNNRNNVRNADKSAWLSSWGK